jgi:hypothetical protein
MGIDDLLEFDEAAYKEKVKKMPIGELISRVNEKEAQMKHGYEHAFVGGFFAIPTFGLSLAESIYGGRKADVAEQKLKIVKDELDHRFKSE